MPVLLLTASGRVVIARYALLAITMLLAACALPPNGRNDHPYSNLPRTIDTHGW